MFKSPGVNILCKIRLYIENEKQNWFYNRDLY